MITTFLNQRFNQALAILLLIGFVTQAHAAVGDTRITTWKDDRTAAFLLMFDDGWPSHWQVAIPEMATRGLVGTFYINPAKAEFTKFKAKWDELMPATGMVYGNHTMSHHGVRDLEHARFEIGECARIVRELQPGKPDRLVSYAQPGVPKGKWNLSNEDRAMLLEEYNLVSRPPFKDHGAVYHKKTLEDMTALIDKAIATKGMEYLVVHGVERIVPNWSYQDFWPLKQAVFLPLLDVLKDKSDKRELWVTDHISQHQYATERDTATITVLKTDTNDIQLRLKSAADPRFYDHPLTLVTEVPADWRECTVAQGATQTQAVVVNGFLTFHAIPNGPVISLSPANAP